MFVIDLIRGGVIWSRKVIGWLGRYCWRNIWVIKLVGWNWEGVEGDGEVSRDSSGYYVIVIW